jgi:hypothetical protein
VDFFHSFGRNWFEFSTEKQTYHLGDSSLSGYEMNELYRNDDGDFTRVSFVSGAGDIRDGRGFVAADFDRDGDLDFFVANNNQQHLYLENRRGSQRSWSVIQLVGRRSNRYGVGARVRLTAGGRTQTREIHVGSGFLSSSPTEAHFGLGEADRIDRVEIRWPSGETQSVENLEAGRIVVVEEGGGHSYRELESPTSDVARH